MRRRHVIALIGLVAVGLLTLAACGEGEPAAPSDVGARAVAMMTGSDGASMGTVTLTQVPSGVLVAADVHGLAAGGHGFHIHSVGACAPDFTAAGGHFDPDETGHGLLVNDTPHPGDLPNIYAGADGAARADVLTAAVTLDAGADHSLFDADGSAIIIHAKPDTYGAEPGAGDRVACGVIKRA
ncbi:MAG: superoxide dismutase family protein [Chloroflexi bacterium]|nr:superoxide dismutase family protein [Chloroflexota bacterium]